MKPAGEAVLILDDALVDDTVDLIRRDPLLGRGTSSSWEEVTPTDYEASERVRSLIEVGVVKVAAAKPTAAEILRALRAFEESFWHAPLPG